MNKKGFTLVEVIVVIAITALLLLILVPNVFVMINKNNKKSCNSLVDNIESAAKIYVTNNKYDLGFGCGTSNNTKTITLQNLIDTGDLSTDSTGKIINPIDKSEISLDKSIVKVTYNCNTKEFNYDIDMYNIDEEVVDCTNN